MLPAGVRGRGPPPVRPELDLDPQCPHIQDVGCISCRVEAVYQRNREKLTSVHVPWLSRQVGSPGGDPTRIVSHGLSPNPDPQL